MKLRLSTRVECDGAEFWFADGLADAELLSAIGALGAAVPLIMTAASGMDFEAIGKLTEEEIKEKFENLELTTDLLPPDVGLRFCELFAAAVTRWECVTDAEGEPLLWSGKQAAEFPTEQKIEVVCEYFNERRKLLGKEIGAERSDTS